MYHSIEADVQSRGCSRPPASDRASSYHSGAGRERQEGSGPTFRPIDCFSLRFEGAEHVVRMVFDDIIVDMSPSGRPLGRAST